MNTLDSKLFRLMLESASNNLSNHRADVDAMNVFPVPDGDTGTNMQLTFSNGVAESKTIVSDSVAAIAKALSKGLLMGARGNSGVIMSQIFRGIALGVENCHEADIPSLAKAFVRGSEVAYRAVMKPVEGTILTVIREGSKAALEYVNQHPDCTVIEYMDTLVAEADKSLQHTPELMPLLKEVGVVDSGGYGLLKILEGFKEAAHDRPFALKDQKTTATAAQTQMESQEFGYCTEFVLRLSETGKFTFEEEKLKRNLSRIGDSLVLVQDDDLVKVHVHTMAPGEVLTLSQRYGEFIKLKIENMSEQHDHIIEMNKTRQKYGIISVAAGEGVIEYFKQLRVDEIINGGQTMNPSTEDFVEAIKKLNAEHIFILPNNSNIILAAQQAQAICDDRDIHVLLTTSVPQGLSACLLFNPNAEVEDNLNEMQEAIERVITGKITYAIKDTTVEGITIKEHDYIGMKNKDIVISSSDVQKSAQGLIDQMYFDDAAILTILCGEDAKQADTDAIQRYAEETYHLETDVRMGNQPVFCYLFGLE